jgi:hypothetical protein
MNPNSAEAKLKGAKAEGEKVQKLDIAQDMAAQAALDASASQPNQSMTQTTSEVAQTVVEAAKNAVEPLHLTNSKKLTGSKSVLWSKGEWISCWPRLHLIR